MRVLLCVLRFTWTHYLACALLFTWTHCLVCTVLYSMRAAPGQSEADFYIGLLDLLAACAPNRLVYRNGLAKREHEEAALLLQASLPVQGVVSALLSVENWAVKLALLRYVLCGFLVSFAIVSLHEVLMISGCASPPPPT